MEGTIGCAAATVVAGVLGAKSGVEEGFLGATRLRAGCQCGGYRDDSYEGKAHIIHPWRCVGPHDAAE
jgi:hypothetical protein